MAKLGRKVKNYSLDSICVKKAEPVYFFRVSVAKNNCTGDTEYDQLVIQFDFANYLLNPIIVFKAKVVI